MKIKILSVLSGHITIKILIIIIINFFWSIDLNWSTVESGPFQYGGRADVT